MMLDKEIILKILADSKKFPDPYGEPPSYYAAGFADDDLPAGLAALYYQKLQYAVQHADTLINSAFRDEFYGFYGVDKTAVHSPAEMCGRLCFDSFVLFPEDQTVGACLSNEQFMFGHFIEVRWEKDRAVRYAWIN